MSRGIPSLCHKLSMYQVFPSNFLTSEHIFMIQSKLRQDILPSSTMILNWDGSGLCFLGWWGCLGSLNKILTVHLSEEGMSALHTCCRVSNLPPCLFSWPCFFLTLYSPSLGEPIVISHSCLLIWSLYKNMLFFLGGFLFCSFILFYLFLSIKINHLQEACCIFSSTFFWFFII